MNKPLSGITVLDMTHVLSGPFCTMHLADNGARVIKIEREKGDESRYFAPFYENGKSAYFHLINRGKESLRLNLKKIEDFKLFERILSKADVLVENFRPGTMEKLGLCPKQLIKKYSQLVVCSISGFGQTGPMAQTPSYDTVMQGVSGAMSFTGKEGGGPTRLGIPVCDLSAGIYAFGAICAALVGRAKTGKGTWIDIGMLDSVWTLLESGIMNVLAKGKDILGVGNRHHGITPFDTFECADKPITVCCANDAIFMRAMEVLGLPELISHPNYKTNALRTQHEKELRQTLADVFKTRNAEHWLKALAEGGVPSGPVNTVGQAAQMPQIQAREMVQDSGGLPVFGTPFKYSEYDSAIAPKPAPEVDADGEALRREFAE